MKKNSNEPAAAANDPVLTRYRQYAAIVTATGGSIPKLLAEERDLRAQLGEVEISGGDIRHYGNASTPSRARGGAPRASGRALVRHCSRCRATCAKRAHW